MKNSMTALVSAAVGLVLLSGCSVQAEEASTSTESRNTQNRSQFACNLGWKHGAEPTIVLARYDEPAVKDWEEDYGGLVANPECTDVQILKWQELRREASESDEICRVTFDFTADARAHILGCVVPVLVVSDAS